MFFLGGTTVRLTGAEHIVIKVLTVEGWGENRLILQAVIYLNEVQSEAKQLIN